VLYVGLFRVERVKDLDFWAVFWQGGGPPNDFELVAAYNLLTDLRVIVFKAETIQSIRWLDRFNLVGKLECFPALDQTEGYQSVFNRNLEQFAAFVRGRGAREEAVASAVHFRETAMHAPNAWAALDWAREWRRQQTVAGSGEVS